MRIGVISDTHGLLHDSALRALSGSNLILHAGDIGRPDILEQLRGIAPTLAVRGNVDRAEWARALPLTVTHEAQGVWLHMLHDLAELDLSPVAAGLRVVISGHSHAPSISERDGVLYLNPGSAGPRRFTLPVSLAQLTVHAGDVSAELVPLPVD